MAHRHVFHEVKGSQGIAKTCTCGRTKVTLDTHALSGNARRMARASARKLRG